jgi:hypothetical protein
MFKIVQGFQDAAFENFQKGGDTKEYIRKIRNSVAHNSHMSFNTRNHSIASVKTQDLAG